MLDALRIPYVAVENYEADDVIATLTTEASRAGLPVVIATGDRDALQLVNDTVTVLYPKRGVSEMTRFTPEEVEAKYGLTPRQYPDYAALRGDPSDNLPASPGWVRRPRPSGCASSARSTSWSQQVDTVPGKAGDALRENLANVLRNRQLTELVRDVRRPDSRRRPRARSSGTASRCTQLFDDLQFRVLRDRLFATVEAAQPEAEEGFDVASPGSVSTRSSMAARARPRRQRGSACRSAGSGAAVTGSVTGIGLAAADGAAAYRRPRRRSTRDDERRSPTWLADATAPKAAHDVKGPPLALREHGWTIARRHQRHRSSAAYLLRPDQRSFDLATWRCDTSSANCARTSRTPVSSRSTAASTSQTMRWPRSRHVQAARGPRSCRGVRSPTSSEAARPLCSPTSSCR